MPIRSVHATEYGCPQLTPCGRHRLERVVGIDWNAWSPSVGTRGRFQWNTHFDDETQDVVLRMGVQPDNSAFLHLVNHLPGRKSIGPVDFHPNPGLTGAIHHLPERRQAEFRPACEPEPRMDPHETLCWISGSMLLHHALKGRQERPLVIRQTVFCPVFDSHTAKGQLNRYQVRTFCHYAVLRSVCSGSGT